MKRRTKLIDDDMPYGKLTVIPDFLPPPSQLVFPKEVNVKVTLSLSKESVDFFKKQAKRHNTKYQQMIRSVVDIYARQQAAKGA